MFLGHVVEMPSWTIKAERRRSRYSIYGCQLRQVIKYSTQLNIIAQPMFLQFISVKNGMLID